MEKYIDGRWCLIPREDQLKMTKLDGQVWIALCNLLLRLECQRKYDFNSFNKSQLLRVQMLSSREIHMDSFWILCISQTVQMKLGIW